MKSFYFLEIHSRNYEVKIKSQENSLKDDNNGLAIHEGF